MSRAKENPKTGTALCHCGRPLGHTGRHVGSQAKSSSRSTGRTKLATAVEGEIKRCHDTIAKLRAEVRDREAELRRAEAELKPLIALHEVYRDLALPAPADPAPGTTTLTAPSPNGNGKAFRIGEGTSLARQVAR